MDKTEEQYDQEQIDNEEAAARQAEGDAAAAQADYEHDDDPGAEVLDAKANDDGE